MEQLSFVDPPNRPMDTTYKPIYGPVLHKDLIFLDVEHNERLLVGSTNVTGSFWEGSVQTFKDHSLYESGTCLSYYNSVILYDGKFVAKMNCMLVSEAPTYLKLFSVPENIGDANTMWKDCVEHEEAIKQIVLWDNELRALTVSSGCLTIWDVNCNSGLKKATSFSSYHTDDITSAATKCADDNIFASTGADRRVCLWDARMDNPAMELYTNEFCSLTSVSWNPTNGNVLAAGTAAGDVYLLDMTQPKEFLSVRHCYKTPVHTIVFSSSGNLAVCGDSPHVQVFSCKKNEFDLISEHSKHTKFVRGLAWFKDTLFSCGFDSHVVKHML